MPARYRQDAGATFLVEFAGRVESKPRDLANDRGYRVAPFEIVVGMGE
jgi:hypothetical protein